MKNQFKVDHTTFINIFIIIIFCMHIQIKNLLSIISDTKQINLERTIVQSVLVYVLI